MARDKYGVDFMSEGDFLVRGTLDPMEALRLAVEEDIDCVIAGFYTTPEQEDLDPKDVQLLAEELHERLQKARPGYYRKVHCLPGSDGDWEGWTWQLNYASGPGRGAFPGVYFRPSS